MARRIADRDPGRTQRDQKSETISGDVEIAFIA
jgi:hypothetical protein